MILQKEKEGGEEEERSKIPEFAPSPPQKKQLKIVHRLGNWI